MGPDHHRSVSPGDEEKKRAEQELRFYEERLGYADMDVFEMMEFHDRIQDQVEVSRHHVNVMAETFPDLLVQIAEARERWKLPEKLRTKAMQHPLLAEAFLDLADHLAELEEAGNDMAPYYRGYYLEEVFIDAAVKRIRSHQELPIDYQIEITSAFPEVDLVKLIDALEKKAGRDWLVLDALWHRETYNELVAKLPQ